MKKKKKISAEEFDRREEAGEELDEYIDWDGARRPGIAKLARNARAATGLSQAMFAERSGIPTRRFGIGSRASAWRTRRRGTTCA